MTREAVQIKSLMDVALVNMILYKFAMLGDLNLAVQLLRLPMLMACVMQTTDREQVGLAINIVNKHYSSCCLVYITYL